MLRFFLLFILIQAVLFSAELLKPVQDALIIPFTESIASLSAALIQWADPSVMAHGVIIQNSLSGFAVAIRAGCNGVEAVIILVAAMLAFPKAPWLYRLLGILIGALTIQALNLLRIISLFYLGQWNRTAFDWAHLYIWEVLIMLDVLIVFLIWIGKLPHHADETH
jgi:exosortase H (IPTLxxWG-CTERM-specific)